MSRQDFYENVVCIMSRDDFYQLFGEYPLDIWDFNYSFNNVHWTAALEYAYNEYINNEE